MSQSGRPHGQRRLNLFLVSGSRGLEFPCIKNDRGMKATMNKFCDFVTKLISVFFAIDFDAEFLLNDNGFLGIF